MAASPDRATRIPRVTGVAPGRRSERPGGGYPADVFFLFSSRLGCLGSLLLSAVLTLVLLLLFDVL